MAQHTSKTPSSTSDTNATPLSRELIVTTALEIADAEGIENLSMRKLAKALGKTAMAPYRYFDSMAEIQQEVLALVFTEVDTTAIPGERWDDTLRRTCASIREVELRHAKAHLSQIAKGAWGYGLRDHTDRIQRLHHAQHIPDEILQVMWRIIDAFLSGFIANEIAEMEHVNALHGPEKPEWAATVEGAYSEQAFFDGINIIISGIRGLAAPDPCEWHTPTAEENAESTDTATQAQ